MALWDHLPGCVPPSWPFCSHRTGAVAKLFLRSGAQHTAQGGMVAGKDAQKVGWAKAAGKCAHPGHTEPDSGLGPACLQPSRGPCCRRRRPLGSRQDREPALPFIPTR